MSIEKPFDGISMEVIDGALVISGARKVTVRSGGDDVAVDYETIKTQCAQDIFETAVRSAMEHGTMDPVDRLNLIRQALDVRFGKNPPKSET